MFLSSACKVWIHPFLGTLCLGTKRGARAESVRVFLFSNPVYLMVSIKLSKFIKSLKIKKYRLRENCFMIEGKKNVLELLSSDFKIKYVIGTREFIAQHSEYLRQFEGSIVEASPKDLVELGTFQSNEDCLAVAEIPSREVEQVSYDDHIIVLDGVSDPGNLGTIIRTLDWYGFRQVICSPDCADIYNPKVINATMGSFKRVKVYYEDLVTFCSNSDLESFGADLEGVALNEWKPQKPSILIMGSESHGISPKLSDLIHSKVTIPKIGEAESLNVAIATAIFCQHLRFTIS
ncbi:MAG: TrmH family RNA methyltransferase [Marinoscillum sp.]|jgi:TrmH family RNA methyltransferase